MNNFIHTFSLTAHLFLWEKDRIEESYREHFFYNSQEQVLVLSKYADRGVRLQIKFNPVAEKKYDKQHRDCKIEIIVTPAKLLHRGDVMCKLFTDDEYIAACRELENIIYEIERQSGVNIWREVKVKRVDITKDVATPNEKYSDEVIRLAKKAMIKPGCHIWKPSEMDVMQSGYQEKDSILFFNHNQGVNSKIYNKVVDLKKADSEFTIDHGLIRFEVSLMRKFLKANKMIDTDYIELNEVQDLMRKVMGAAERLLKAYTIDAFLGGYMVAKKIQKKAIQRYCNHKPGRYERMLAYRDFYNKGKEAFEIADPKRRERVAEHYVKLGLSPIYTSPEFDFIPSFSDILEGKWNFETCNNGEREKGSLQNSTFVS